MKTTRDQNKHVVEIGQSRDVSNTCIAYHGVISPILGVDQEILTSILKGVADKKRGMGAKFKRKPKTKAGSLRILLALRILFFISRIFLSGIKNLN